MAKSLVLPEDATKALREFEEASTHHEIFCSQLERRYRAYRGVMEVRTRDADNPNVLTPPYVNHIVETTLASLLDENMRFKVRPRPKLYNPGEFEVQKQGAKALEILLDWQLSTDHFSEKQRWFVLQNMIAGVTAAKVYWRSSGRMKKQWGTEPHPVIDPMFGTVLGYVPKPVVTEEYDQAYDGPCIEVCNVADLIWDAHATSVDNCRIIAHRVWKTFAECKEMAAERVHEAIRWKNVDALKESRDQTSQRNDWAWPTDQERPADDKRIEILEIWMKDEQGIIVHTLGNRKVLLSTRRNPYWHGEFPFTIAAGQSDLFRLSGMSQVEKIQALQEGLWEISDQRLRNLRLINNAIVIHQEEMMDDPDGNRFGPGEQWTVRGPVDEAIKLWSPTPLPSQVSIPAENMIKADIQNLAGGFPFTSTSEASNVKADTATEAALVSSLAQRSVSQAKVQLNYAYRRIGQQMVELNQQYITDPLLVTVVGADDEYELKEIVPEMLRGSYEFDISPMNESLMRQEKRAESGAFMQQMSAVAPLAAAMAAQGLGRAVNMDAVIEDYLEAHEKADKDRFFVSKPPPVPPPAPGQGGPGGEGSGQGTTGTGSIDPAVSPSNAMSMSPATADARYQSQRGGTNNIG